MRVLALCLFLLAGCTSITDAPKAEYRDNKTQLERDIYLLKLEIRKARLERALENLEKD